MPIKVPRSKVLKVSKNVEGAKFQRDLAWNRKVYFENNTLRYTDIVTEEFLESAYMNEIQILEGLKAHNMSFDYKNKIFVFGGGNTEKEKRTNSKEPVILGIELEKIGGESILIYDYRDEAGVQDRKIRGMEYLNYRNKLYMAVWDEEGTSLYEVLPKEMELKEKASYPGVGFEGIVPGPFNFLILLEENKRYFLVDPLRKGREQYLEEIVGNIEGYKAEIEGSKIIVMKEVTKGNEKMVEKVKVVDPFIGQVIEVPGYLKAIFIVDDEVYFGTKNNTASLFTIWKNDGLEIEKQTIAINENEQKEISKRKTPAETLPLSTKLLSDFQNGYILLEKKHKKLEAMVVSADLDVISDKELNIPSSLIYRLIVNAPEEIIYIGKQMDSRIELKGNEMISREISIKNDPRKIYYEEKHEKGLFFEKYKFKKLTKDLELIGKEGNFINTSPAMFDLHPVKYLGKNYFWASEIASSNYVNYITVFHK